MTTSEKTTITVSVSVNSPVEKVWDIFTTPHHILHWNNASDDWHTTLAENDLRPGGKFLSRMEARDGSFGFDLTGVYSKVDLQRRIEYTLDDGRKVKIDFSTRNNVTEVVESFEAENENPPELQREGWQAIMNNFKKYVESFH
jgi:uncharacterized protein YndB with AHSA1/START domain